MSKMRDLIKNGRRFLLQSFACKDFARAPTYIQGCTFSRAGCTFLGRKSREFERFERFYGSFDHFSAASAAKVMESQVVTKSA